MDKLDAKALIFDLDGVLVNTHGAVSAAWAWWGAEHGLDPALVERTIPGMRARDAVELLAPHVDSAVEFARIVEREQSHTDLMVEVPGAGDVLRRLPSGRWGIATSGERHVAESRLVHAGLPIPEVFITAENVTNGKPDPEVYLRALAGLGMVAQDCIVFEDAPVGVASGKAAGCRVIGVVTNIAREHLDTPFAVRDFRSAHVTISANGLVVQLDPYEA